MTFILTLLVEILVALLAYVLNHFSYLVGVEKMDQILDWGWER
jgi:hypothetical protein